MVEGFSFRWDKAKINNTKGTTSSLWCSLLECYLVIIIFSLTIMSVCPILWLWLRILLLQGIEAHSSWLKKKESCINTQEGISQTVLEEKQNTAKAYQEQRLLFASFREHTVTLMSASHLFIIHSLNMHRVSTLVLGTWDTEVHEALNGKRVIKQINTHAYNYKLL